MTDRPHLRITAAPNSVDYRWPGEPPRAPFATPARDRVPHARKLRAEIVAATGEFESLRETLGVQPTAGLTLKLRSAPGFELKLDSLDRRGVGIELLSVITDPADSDVMVATVFVPHTALKVFLRLLSDYETKLTQTERPRPRNQDLVESISEARLAIVQDFWQDVADFPAPNTPIHWEVWLRSTEGYAETVHARFAEHCTVAGLRPNRHYVAFPDRVVTIAFGTSGQISRSLDLMTTIAELRRARELASEYLQQPGRFQREVIDDFLARVRFAGADAPAVLVLDTGVNAGHPLLEPALAPTDRHSIDPNWTSADDERQHGTGMAGIALYGDLADAFQGNEPLTLRHRLESARILPPPPAVNEPDVYGAVTEQGVSRAIIAAPDRNRVICMAITTDDTDGAIPSAWSGAIDQMCAGVADGEPKLMLISAGNIRDLASNPDYVYGTTNCEDAGVEDPGQSWNALTVGAYTEKMMIRNEGQWNFRPVAPLGDLCPTSRTSLAWGDPNFPGWPIKPDIVMEGGNYATDGRIIDGSDDLSLLSTALTADGSLLQPVGDTSAATGAAARFTATIESQYPDLWPETVRALTVHSAEWKEAMIARFPGDTKAAAEKRLRTYGYGVPNIRRALYSVENAVTLVAEHEIQPFRLDGSAGRANVMHLHHLPWPRAVLEDLGDTEVMMRVTLSYFIEPSPGRRGWSTSSPHRYQSHGLRFDVIRVNEDEQAFRRRRSRAEWENDVRPGNNTAETRNWVVGEANRSHGSLHCDWWRGLASDLATSDRIAVYPVTGWWKERPHKRRVESLARYSLVVSIETPRQDVDLYTAIANQIAIDVEA